MPVLGCFSLNRLELDFWLSGNLDLCFDMARKIKEKSGYTNFGSLNKNESNF